MCIRDRYEKAGDKGKTVECYTAAAKQASDKGDLLKAGEMYEKAGDAASAKESYLNHFASIPQSEINTFYWTEGNGKNYEELLETVKKGNDKKAKTAFDSLRVNLFGDNLSDERKVGLLSLKKYFEAGVVYLAWIINRGLLVDKLSAANIKGYSAPHLGVSIPSSSQMASSGTKQMIEDIKLLKLAHSLIEDKKLRKRLKMLAFEFGGIEL